MPRLAAFGADGAFWRGGHGARPGLIRFFFFSLTPLEFLMLHGFGLFLGVCALLVVVFAAFYPSPRLAALGRRLMPGLVVTFWILSGTVSGAWTLSLGFPAFPLWIGLVLAGCVAWEYHFQIAPYLERDIENARSECRKLRRQLATADETSISWEAASEAWEALAAFRDNENRKLTAKVDKLTATAAKYINKTAALRESMTEARNKIGRLENETAVQLIALDVQSEAMARLSGKVDDLRAQLTQAVAGVTAADLEYITDTAAMASELRLALYLANGSLESLAHDAGILSPSGLSAEVSRSSRIGDAVSCLSDVMESEAGALLTPAQVSRVRKVLNRCDEVREVIDI